MFGKALNENGVLALCGFYTVDMVDTLGRISPEGPDRVIREQLGSPNSVLWLDGEVVGNLTFMRPHGPSEELQANCVTTRIPWKESFAKAKVRFQWPALSLHG
jgi:hypothetical protein